MKRCTAFICTIILLVLCAAPAFASNFYMIPDSNTRRLTREELWTWQYDALGYIFNEIFARHGYHFEPGGRYDNYFRSQAWYQENPIYDNQGIYANLMTNIEWANERLVKEVRAEMRALGTTNEGGKVLPAVAFEPEIYGAFSQFQKVYFASDQRLPVYSGPGTQYHRSANGKALASTNGNIYVGGWENGWLMIMYWTNDYNVRVGFTQSSNFKDKIDVPHLRFSYAPATITRRIALTDDPVASFQPMATLDAGTQVTYLSEFFNEKHWAYVEVTVAGVQMRGFLEADAVSLLGMEVDEPSFAPADVVAEEEKAAVPEPPAAKAPAGYIKHAFWGISPENWDTIPAVLRDKKIPYEETDAGFVSKEGQPIVMFDIPVRLYFYNEYGIGIYTADEWRVQGDGPISDDQIQKTMDAYDDMLRATQEQYGSPTGGLMRTTSEWDYPIKDGRLDWETVKAALAHEGAVYLSTFYHNIDVSWWVHADGDTYTSNVSMQYRYDPSAHGEDYDALPLETLLSFECPAGPYTTEPSGPIEITFEYTPDAPEPADGPIEIVF